MSTHVQATSTTIDRNLLCDGCEYNLRGLTVEGRCPECGLAIERSIAAQSLGLVSLGQLKLARATQVLLLLEFFAAASAGSFAFKLLWYRSPLQFVPIALTVIAWISAIAIFCLIAWMHRERQPVDLRWPWIARYAGVIICATSIVSTATRVAFTFRPMRILIVVGFLAIALTAIPAFSAYTLSRRLRNAKRLASANIACSIASLFIATWCALSIYSDIPSAPANSEFTAMPIAGVDYATLLVPMLSSEWMTTFRPIGIVMIVVRGVWVVLVLMMLRSINRQIHQRRADAAEKIPASSHP